MSRGYTALLATAGVVALGTTLLLTSSGSKEPTRVVHLHKDIATEINEGEQESETLDSEHAYDIVIIGGGTAGCVAASRLSENPKISVLLLESGQSAMTLPFSQIPSGYGKLMRTRHDHNLWTEPQPHAGGKKKYWPRGNMLGGSSSMNAMMFHHGDPADYDYWSETMKGEPGADQWNYENFSKYLQKFERYVPHVDHPTVDTTLRGKLGLMKVGYYANFSKLCGYWVQSCAKVGIPTTSDFNTPAGTLGVGRDVLQRPNLRVATFATVLRVLFSNDKAVGVEFTDRKAQKKYRVSAKQEVLLCAGAVHTPHILLLSGIGPADHLKQFEIPVVKDLPGVGSHLMDHAAVIIRLKVTPGMSNTYLQGRSKADIARALLALWQFRLFGTGPLASNVAEAACFVRTSNKKLFPPDLYPNIIEDISTGPNAPDLEVLSAPTAWTEHGAGPIAPGESVNMIATALSPSSLGTIRLKSSNPLEPPAIDPNYLAEKHDVDVLVRGIQLMLRIAKAPPLADVVLPDDWSSPLLDDKLHKASIEELEAIVRERVETLYHPTSTARMAPLSKGGVVDAQLRVYGIPNLRIADASAFPSIISGHTAAPSLAIGEKVADLILAELR